MNHQEETVKMSSSAKNGSLPSLLYVSPAPHMRKLDTVRSIMLDVIIALLPALAFGIYQFGLRALWIVLISVATAVASEGIYEVIAKKTLRISDLSSAVTGLFVGLMLPSGVDLWVPLVGSAFAVIVAKQFFGGIGKNVVNPAICARVFLMLCWPAQMTAYADKSGELVSKATALVQLKAGNTPSFTLFNLVIGNSAGAIGEVSAIALGAGFIYLFCRKVVTWHIPVSFLGTVALISILSPITGETSAVFYQLLSGGLLLSALFCANDYATCPVTAGGKLIFGAGCGLVTVMIRYFGAYPDGCAFAILLMNLLVPLFEAWTKPKKFGGRNEKVQ